MSFKRVPLGELLDGKGYIRGPFGSALKRADMHESGIPVYEQQHAIYGHRDFRYFIQDDKFQKLNRFQVQSNDLIISCSGTVGRISIIKESDPQGIISQALLILRVDSQKLLPDFLYYFLTSPVGKRELLNASQGAVQQNIAPRAVVEKIEVPLPDMSIQKLIVNQLKNLDKKVWVNTTINETLEEMAQAIFKSWFVDFDPVKTKMNGEQPEGMDAATASLFPEKLVESELGLIPEGWEVGALSSVVDVIMGQSPKGSTYNDQNEGTPLVNGPVEFGVYHPVAQKWTTAPTKMSKNKDLIVCVRGSTTGRYVVSDGEYCLGRGVCSIRSNDFPSFANYLFKSELNSLLHLTTGSTFPSWSGPTLKNFKVVVPPETIIEKFELLIGKLCEMMARNTGQNETLSTLRDTLLPKLLSGEIELGETEEMAEVN
ncbi:restriction endonuclease subunit S [Vibrio fluvialis]|uniref:restriction endonuclease subunit S n=1 Tax=Vibrio fluvialis TaxID=676 RepID=UPI001F34C9BF|nr:restriction endonuclease subunit S [Vibrio fluvialis]MCE7580851.1 restriction endonuclease subunit S [Vibrio fluvialis]